MREFAEQEIWIPGEGPHSGKKFNCRTQPFTREFFELVENAPKLGINKFYSTGPQQSGKTLLSFVIPILYHLFEMKETVVVACPNADIVHDKWNIDILPIIKASKYKDLLPIGGAASRGGKIGSSVSFRNGTTIRFMTAGGDDKSRASFTTRIVVITETDGMDEASDGSREADKLKQIIGRARAHGANARIYAECTVSVEEGRTWTEYSQGTRSRIAIKCPYCKRFVSPERSNLVGWREAIDVIEAKELGHFECPECKAAWSEKDRLQANQDMRVIHRGQTVDENGVVSGPMPRTDTLGFRWSAVNNTFVSQGLISGDEWKSSRAEDEENEEKEQSQFVWAIPYRPKTIDLTKVDYRTIMRRMRDKATRGVIPIGAGRVTVGVDVGGRACHWTAATWFPGATPHVFDYGILEVPSDEMGYEHAIIYALREFRDRICAKGWPVTPKSGETSNPEDLIRKPSLVLIDSGWKPDPIYYFARERESGQRFMATKGWGETQDDPKPYRMVTRMGPMIYRTFPADGYHIAFREESSREMLVHINVDQWKSWLHERVKTPIDNPGAMTLFDDLEPNDRLRGKVHFSFSKHLTAEKQIEEFKAGEGTVIVWKKISQNNHWLDSTALAFVAGHMVGERLLGESIDQGPVRRGEPPKQFTTPDGRPYLVTQR